MVMILLGGSGMRDALVQGDILVLDSVSVTGGKSIEDQGTRDHHSRSRAQLAHGPRRRTWRSLQPSARASVILGIASS